MSGKFDMACFCAAEANKKFDNIKHANSDSTEELLNARYWLQCSINEILEEIKHETR